MSEAMHKEIRICGFGGQGIILAGVVLGEAAVKAGYWAVQTQSYGPEARGGAARSEVIIASEPIDFPRVTAADVTVALSQPAYDRYVTTQAAGDGVVVIEGDLVEAPGAVARPFVRTAESVGHKIVTNIVMLGYLNAYLDLIPPELLEETVAANVPARTVDLNREAVRAGRRLCDER
jgi:2-oxoglutarate ferredoxin oxidoreductase subunit gamma